MKHFCIQYLQCTSRLLLICFRVQWNSYIDSCDMANSLGYHPGPSSTCSGWMMSSTHRNSGHSGLYTARINAPSEARALASKFLHPQPFCGDGRGRRGPEKDELAVTGAAPDWALLERVSWVAPAPSASAAVQSITSWPPLSPETLRHTPESLECGGFAE